MRGYRRFRKYGRRAFPVHRQDPYDDGEQDMVDDIQQTTKVKDIIHQDQALSHETLPMETSSHIPHTTNVDTPSCRSEPPMPRNPVHRLLRDCIPDDQWVYNATPDTHPTSETMRLDMYPPAMIQQIRFLHSFARKRAHFGL